MPTPSTMAPRSSPRCACRTSPGARALARLLRAAGPRAREVRRRRPVDHADVVVLAAGTLGSTEILLRSREEGLAVSDRARRALHRQWRRARLRLQQRRAGQRHRRRRAAGCRDGPRRSVHHRPHRSARHAQARGRHGDRGGLDPLGAGADPAGAARRRRRQASARTPTGASSTSSASVRAGARACCSAPTRAPLNRTQTYLVMSHDDGNGPHRARRGPPEAVVAEGRRAADLREGRSRTCAGRRRRRAAPTRATRSRTRCSGTTSSPCIRSAAAHGPRPHHAASSTTSARCSTATRTPAMAPCARTLRVRRLRHSAPARRQSAADDHGAGRAGDDPSRQGSRLEILRDAEVRCAHADRRPGRPRDARAGRRRVHRAHGRLHLADGHDAARDGGAARQGGRPRAAASRSRC